MTDRTLPESNYELVLSHDRELFLNTDKHKILKRTRLSLSDDGSCICIPVLGTGYEINCSTGAISSKTGDLSVHTQLLLLHYLIYSKDSAHISGTEVPFHSLKGVSHFYQAFLNSTMPLLHTAFDHDLASFIKAGRSLNGSVLSLGNASIKLPVFPMISITFIIWEGDEEFPTNINILFDDAVTTCIHPEDVPVLGTFAAQKLTETANLLKN